MHRYPMLPWPCVRRLGQHNAILSRCFMLHTFAVWQHERVKELGRAPQDMVRSIKLKSDCTSYTRRVSIMLGGGWTFMFAGTSFSSF